MPVLRPLSGTCSLPGLRGGISDHRLAAFTIAPPAYVLFPLPAALMMNISFNATVSFLNDPTMVCSYRATGLVAGAVTNHVGGCHFSDPSGIAVTA